MRDPHRATHDLKEVDEHLAAQQFVQLLFARGVLGHQALERGGFVVSVVVDVEVRPAAQPLP